ncbi:single-stranded DNA-binding protein [Nocardioides pantholopis]|uniref:single-stranded DNA-binding protein n=1 Tax=Nocardioides pantholopis TaxID=2483798 RepID=UPI000FDADAD5|nr:single-stranded DNA-binding protein [Nocardioides pantholopis]
MSDTLVTLQGWLGGDVTLRQAAGVPVASFRVACTPRRYQRSTDTWGDGPTQWYTVNVWRGLAENAARSLRRGDPVVLHGRLNLSVWVNAQGEEVTTFEVDAVHVGHDLSRGTSAFTRTPRPTREAADAAADGAGPAGTAASAAPGAAA